MALGICAVPLLLGRPAHAQGGDGSVYWHLDPGVKTCSMVIDPALTQAQWRTFVRQAGAMIGFKSLAPAAPRARGSYSLGLDYSVTPVDQHDPAWINTFTHPDASCPLGDQIKLPALRATLGVTSRMEAAGFWTMAPQANYGLVGGALKYAFLSESARRPAAAAFASVTSLTGVPDFNFVDYGLGLEASKRFTRFTPYAGVTHTLAVGTVTTSKVDIARETLPLSQAFVGATYAIWNMGVAVEYDVSSVNTFALRIGYQPGADSQ